MKKHATCLFILLLTGLVLFQMNTYASAVAREDAQLVYDDGQTQPYMVQETEAQALEATAGPIAPGIAQNVKTTVKKDGENVEQYNFKPNEVPYFYFDYMLLYDATDIVTFIVQGPYPSTKQVFKKVLTFTDDKMGNYYAWQKGKAFKQPGLYTVTGTVTVQGKQNNKVLSKETCRFYVE